MKSINSSTFGSSLPFQSSSQTVPGPRRIQIFSPTRPNIAQPGIRQSDIAALDTSRPILARWHLADSSAEASLYAAALHLLFFAGADAFWRRSLDTTCRTKSIANH